VKTGEKIKQGQLIGQMGISGDADYVHIHYQLQNGFDLNAEALPSYFRNFRRILGSTSSKVEKGQMSSGDIVENYAIR
jgi:murein DD-endopeptidase MepM/ murein hydrolase activator NlpD